MSRAEKVRDFDPNSPGDPNSSLFGLPFDTSEAEVIVVPVPWDVTVSYKDGASRGPDAILQASVQVDLFDPSVPDAWKIGLAMDEISDEVREAATRLREDAKRYIDAITTGIDPLSVAATDNIRTAVNEGSLWLKTGSRPAVATGWSRDVSSRCSAVITARRTACSRPSRAGMTRSRSCRSMRMPICAMRTKASTSRTRRSCATPCAFRR
jgi:hypothetical protein